MRTMASQGNLQLNKGSRPIWDRSGIPHIVKEQYRERHAEESVLDSASLDPETFDRCSLTYLWTTRSLVSKLIFV
jgi:hypothetical protein